MRIKTKLTLGVGLLFLLIILLSLSAIKYINELKADTENILVANYNSMEYARNMLESLEKNEIDVFEKSLQKQEQNNSEIGEAEATQTLRYHFNEYKKNKNTAPLIRKNIFKIMDMNMQAIQRKSDLAIQNSTNATTFISIIGTLCFFIAFILLVNLPSNIANPVKELTESIKQIAAGKYAEKVHFEDHNEFGDLAHSFNTMSKKLYEYNNSNLAKLMTEKKRIETLINNMHDPVIGLDENLNIIFINEIAQEIIGLKNETLIGKHANELALENDLIRSLIRDLKSNESTDKTPLKIYANHKESYFERENLKIHITPTGENEEILIGYVIILRNVTEYKELDVAKTNFIATVSHELKTPISSIKMSLQLLENKKIGIINEEQKNLIDSIKDDAGRLLKITGELLNMTQIDSGKVQLTLYPSQPKEILNYAIEATQTQASNKHIKFDLNYPEKIANINVDTEKTAWVLINLISNAIRYSYENSTIFISIQQTDENINFLIKDMGQGISPQYKDKIFDRYFRVPGTKKEGTGLGLTISKEFIEAQGGKITVNSEFGLGSEFMVTFPILKV
ncbi:MAG: cell wall metabolism sensor histidine kinase WalK [Sphingobacteriaceae bacterium]|nr:cell wall metabolism sensor histidine kinase WalK [Sphingobacteriaceae bacterium]